MVFDGPFGPGGGVLFVLLGVVQELLFLTTALVLLIWLARHWR